MLMGVMTTDYGPHPAEKWALTTAGQIVQIGASASGKNAAEGRKLELQIIDILEEAHAHVLEHERGKIKEVGDERLSHPLDPTEHIDDPFDAVMKVAAASPWADHFAKPEVKDYVRQVIGNNFATSMHIERSWHADRNPDSDHAKKFKARLIGAAPAQG